jgi:hypothetical protein
MQLSRWNAEAPVQPDRTASLPVSPPGSRPDSYREFFEKQIGIVVACAAGAATVSVTMILVAGVAELADAQDLRST